MVTARKKELPVFEQGDLLRLREEYSGYMLRRHPFIESTECHEALRDSIFIVLESGKGWVRIFGGAGQIGWAVVNVMERA